MHLANANGDKGKRQVTLWLRLGQAITTVWKSRPAGTGNNSPPQADGAPRLERRAAAPINWDLRQAAPTE